MSMSDNIIRPEQWLSNAQSSVSTTSNEAFLQKPDLGGGGGGPHDPEMEARVAVLEQIAKSTAETLARIERRLDGLASDFNRDSDEIGKRIDNGDARLRAVEVKLGEIGGKLDLLVGKIPSWWHAPLSAGGLIVLLLSAFTLAQHFGLVVSK